MSRLLSGASVATHPHRLDAPAPVIDDATRELLARTEAAAYQRGLHDGAREAAAAHAAAAEQAATAVQQALAVAREQWTTVERERAEQLIRVGREIATAVLAHEPRADGLLVLQRLADAASELDHGPFTMRVSPADHELVDQGRSRLPVDATVVVDATLAPGDARITGPWSEADLTLQAVLDVVTEALGPAHATAEQAS